MEMKATLWEPMLRLCTAHSETIPLLLSQMRNYLCGNSSLSVRLAMNPQRFLSMVMVDVLEVFICFAGKF